jgi:hypothetical protein
MPPLQTLRKTSTRMVWLPALRGTPQESAALPSNFLPFNPWNMTTRRTVMMIVVMTTTTKGLVQDLTMISPPLLLGQHLPQPKV